MKLANVYTLHCADEHYPPLSRRYDIRLHHMRRNASGINHEVLDCTKAVWVVSWDNRKLFAPVPLQIVLVDVVLSAPPIRDVRVSV